MTAFAAILLSTAALARPLERVSTMDPALAQSAYDARAISLVYEFVLSIDYVARPYRLVPGFCEMPTVSEDGLVYRFRVRKPARALDARDVVRSLERLRDPAVVSPNAWILKDVATIAAPNRAEVEIVLARPVHYFPWLMAMPAAAVCGAHGEGTGDYRLADWWKNHEMRFVRRESLAGGFDEIRYLVIDDPSTQWLMFLKGEVDILGEIPRDNWSSIVGADGRLVPELASRGIALETAPALDVLYNGINMEDPVLGPNRKLRQALNAAFDEPAWSRFHNGRILPADGPVPPGVEGRLETPFAYRSDLARAKHLLAEAGYPGGIDAKTGRRLTLTLTIGRATQESRESGELLASFYEKVGIRLELAYMTWDAFLKAVNDGRVQMYRMGWVGDYPDAQNYLQLFHSKNKSPGPNHSRYANAAFDRAYEAALAAPDARARNRHWARCQEIVREDCPWVFCNFNVLHSLVRARVGNYVQGCFPNGSERHYRVREERRK